MILTDAVVLLFRQTFYMYIKERMKEISMIIIHVTTHTAVESTLNKHTF